MDKTKSAASSAKDVFSYLLMMIMLYVGVVSFLTLIFQYINVQFPDDLDFYYAGSLELIRGAMSAIIIAWPVCLFMNWFVGRDLKLDETKGRIWIRKWMMHLTVFVAAVAIIIDLITLVNNFLGGELTIRFGLKVLSILIVAALVFTYELWELRRDVIKATKLPLMAGILSSVVILGWIIAGFFLVGSPATQRQVRMDAQRISDLQSIQYRLLDEWTFKGVLPETLAELEDPIYGFVVPTDPETGMAYDYTLTDDLSFDLCATFARADENSGRQTFVDYPVTMYGGDKSMEYWDHEAGYTCFSRTIDPELYHTEAIVK